jgi:hypothetical protein
MPTNGGVCVEHPSARHLTRRGTNLDEAMLLLRATIDFTLKQGRASRYRHAARHLAECASLASSIGDFGAVEPHERYSDRLKQAHSRKTSFWALVP